MLLISLIGEQPIPNLLPIRHLKPSSNLLVYTDNEEASKKPAQRLRKLLSGISNLDQDLLLKDAYRVDLIRSALREKLAGGVDIVFNLTGGTKPMSLAAQDLAREMNVPCVYYQTEGNRKRDQQSVLYHYVFKAGILELDKREPLPENLVSLDDYLLAYLPGYEIAGLSRDSGGDLEKAVGLALKDHVDELMTGVKPTGVRDQVEIDLLVRRGNHVAVLEVKSGGSGSSKKALDQLTTTAAREYLGSYATRILITRGDDDTRSDWYKALAQSMRVNVIVLQHPLQKNGQLSSQDSTNVVQRLAELLPLRFPAK